MKKIILIIFIGITSNLVAQSLTGYWQGTLNLGIELKIGFKITGHAPDFIATTDSPDQGVFNMESSVENRTDSFIIHINSIQAHYKGEINWKDSTVSGNWIQAGMPFALNLKKTNSPPQLRRPQTPKEPYTYEVREVQFRNLKNTLTLSGTLTLPKDQKPKATVVMISGSGPQDRDETILEHKPFLVIADYFTRNGIAVLRYDDHGTGKSEGDFETASMYDFIDDVKGAVKYLKTIPEIDSTKIGLLGHSEGGMIGLVIAAENPQISFFISMAGPGVKSSELMVQQAIDIYRINGIQDEKMLNNYRTYLDGLYAILQKKSSTEKMKNDIEKHIRTYDKKMETLEKQIFKVDTSQIDELTEYLTGNWFLNFIQFNPAPYIQKINCPVMALWGEKDLQVAAIPNFEGYTKNLNRNDKSLLKKYPDLNHLFQHSETGNIREYGKIEETISEEVLNDMKDFILKLYP